MVKRSTTSLKYYLYSALSLVCLLLPQLALASHEIAEIQATQGSYTDRVRIEWTAYPGARYYNVQRAPTTTGPFTTIAAGILNTHFEDFLIDPLVDPADPHDVYYYYSIEAALFGEIPTEYSGSAVGWRVLPSEAYTVSGMISTSDGSPPGGIMVTDGYRSAVTDGSGSYALQNVPQGSYTIVAAKPGYTATPGSRLIQITNSDRAGQNFLLSPFTEGVGTLFGNVQKISPGGGLGLVLISLNGQQFAAYSDNNGDYIITGIPAGAHTVSAKRILYNITPEDGSSIVSISDSGTSQKNFVAPMTRSEVSGRVVMCNDPFTSLSGVWVAADWQYGALTDANGFFTITYPSDPALHDAGPVPDGPATITGSKAGYVVEPQNFTNPINVNPNHIPTGQPITGLVLCAQAGLTVSGYVRMEDGTGVENVRIEHFNLADSPYNGVTFTGENGFYSFRSPEHTAYFVTAAKTGYTIEYEPYVFLQVGAILVWESDRPNVDFRAELTTYDVSGRVTLPDGTGLPGVTVETTHTEFGSFSTTTDANGDYTLANLPDGTYSISAVRAGFTIAPDPFVLALNAQDHTDIDFDATLDAPTNLQASDGDPNHLGEVYVNWDNHPAAVSIQVYRRVEGTSSFGQVGSDLLSGSTNFSDSSAMPGVVYEYLVRALYLGVTSADSNIDSGYRWNDDGSIIPPNNLDASDGLPNFVRVTWNGPQAATGFRIYRAPQSGGSFSALSPDAASGASGFNDVSAIPGVIYRYLARTLDGAQESANSNIDTGYRWNANGTIPAPRNVAATDGNPSHPQFVRVTWNEVGGATGYRVYKRTNGSGASFSALTPDAASGIIRFDDTSALPGVVYDYMVRALNNAEQSANSNIDSGYRWNNDGSLPAPRNVRASDGDPAHPQFVRVTWNRVGGATSYRVYRRLNESGGAFSSFSPDASSTQTSFDDRSAVPGVLYDYMVRARAGSRQSANSNIDSGFRLNDDGSIPAPRDLRATDGDLSHPAFVRVTWKRIAGADGYRVYRRKDGTSSTFSQISPTTAAGASSFDDSSAVPGVIYEYTARTVMNGSRSGISNIDTGYRWNDDGSLPAPTEVQASDGTSPAFVAVTWRAVGGATSYKVFRATTADGPGVEISSRVTDTTYHDTSGVPCFKYHYFVKAVDSTQVSAESERDTGFKASTLTCDFPPSIPLSLQASDGTSEDYVIVTWTLAEFALSYQVYRSQFQGAIGVPLGSPVTALEYRDRSAVPGVHYYYSVKALNDVGESGFSNVDRGFRLDPSGVADCDGDGVSDAQEAIDGTGICDPGSFQLHLKSPAFTKYNTFLEQWNFLELMASGIKPLNLTITVFDINGSVIGVQHWYLEPLSQVDLDINTIVQQIDTYGVVRIDFNNEPGATLVGRMSNYRLNPDGVTYSFAFAKELRNPTRGITHAAGNSVDPQSMGFLVANWAEIINLDDIERRFTYRLLGQGGNLLEERIVDVPPLGERDIQAGHENGEGAYLASFEPHDGATKYFATVTRYSSNAPPGHIPETYNFAIPLDSRAGNGTRQLLPTTNTQGGCWSQTNWVEVINVREIPVKVELLFRNLSGEVVGSFRGEDAEIIQPGAQRHFFASAMLGKGNTGSVEIIPLDAPGSLIAEGLVYFHDCSANVLQSAYASLGRIPGRDKQAGTYNRFLGMTNLLKVISTSAGDEEFTLNVTGLGGTLVAEQVHTVSGFHSTDFNISDGSIFDTAPDTYGTISLKTDGPEKILAEVVRMRELDGKVDFVMPTAVQ